MPSLVSHARMAGLRLWLQAYAFTAQWANTTAQQVLRALLANLASTALGVGAPLALNARLASTKIKGNTSFVTVAFLASGPPATLDNRVALPSRHHTRLLTRLRTLLRSQHRTLLPTQRPSQRNSRHLTLHLTRRRTQPLSPLHTRHRTRLLSRLHIRPRPAPLANTRWPGLASLALLASTRACTTRLAALAVPAGATPLLARLSALTARRASTTRALVQHAAVVL